MNRHITVLIPAHNEQDRISAALDSVFAQTLWPNRIVVVCDNCTDYTETVARSLNVEVYETINNQDKKAGGLNQVLDLLLPRASDDDLFLVMDADSTISADFIETAVNTLNADDTIGAVGGIFLGESGAGLLGELQRNEYVRYQRQINRKRGKAMVLTGTATVHRADVLNRLVESRNQVYDTSALTEDNEITLAIKTLGYKCVSPKNCLVETEVMPTWSDLYQQRLRWQRGALENLRAYGFNKVTRPYVVQQSGMIFGVFAMWMYFAYTTFIIATGQFGVHPIWTSLGAVFIAERVVTVWRRGMKARLLAGVLVVEWVYDLFLQGVLIRSIYDMILKRQAKWHHVNDSELLDTA